MYRVQFRINDYYRDNWQYCLVLLFLILLQRPKLYFWNSIHGHLSEAGVKGLDLSLVSGEEEEKGVEK